MSTKIRNKRARRGKRRGGLRRALADTKLAANVTEEADWYLDTPDIRLTRIFSVVLILHVVAVGGILAFKMIDKASANNSIQLISQTAERSEPKEAVQKSVDVAAKQKMVAQPAKVPATAPEMKNTEINPQGKIGSGENQYKVQVGDTLPEIARETGINIEALRSINDIRSDNELYPGRWIDLKPRQSADAPPQKAAKAEPVSAEPKPANVPAAKPATPAAASGTYEVKPGDTAWAISRKFGVSYQELLNFNGVDKPESLQIGQVLKIPGSN